MSYPEIETINRKEEMNACPVCATPSDKAIASTPYFECPTCALWFQSPLPPKVYQAPTEYDLAGMPEGDRAVNRDLAARLFDTVMGGLSGRTLDIGAKHPVLASACWLVPLAIMAGLVSMRPTEPSLDSPSTGRGIAGARCATVAEAHLPDRRAMSVAFVACMERYAAP